MQSCNAPLQIVGGKTVAIYNILSRFYVNDLKNTAEGQ